MRLITHFDLDGAVSNIIIQKFLPVSTMKCCGYSKFSDKIDEIKQGEPVLFTDVSLTEDQVNSVREKTDRWHIIDHHENTGDIADSFSDNVYFSLDYCGAELCRQWCKKMFSAKYDSIWTDELQELVDLTNVYDMWQTDHKHWQKAYNLNLLFWKYSFWKFSSEFENGYNLTNKHRQDIKDKLTAKAKLFREADTFVEDDTLLTICNREVINDFTLIYPDCKLYMMISIGTDNGVTSISVRSKSETINMNDICRKLKQDYVIKNYIKSAGGHQKASGIVMLPEVEMSDILEVCELISFYYHNTNHLIGDDEIPF